MPSPVRIQPNIPNPLYCCIFLKFQIDLGGFSHKSQNISHNWGCRVPAPDPVRGPWPGEKPIFGADRNRQSSPGCIRMSPQRAKITDTDLPKMHFGRVGGGEAPPWTKMYLGEVYIGQNGLLRGHSNASRGSLTIPVRPKDRFLHGLCGDLGACVSLNEFAIGMAKKLYS